LRFITVKNLNIPYRKKEPVERRTSRIREVNIMHQHPQQAQAAEVEAAAAAAGLPDGTDAIDADERQAATKLCTYCGMPKPLSDFRRRTGRRAGKASRRGACRACRKLRRAAPDAPAAEPVPRPEAAPEAPPAAPRRRIIPPRPIEPPPVVDGPDASVLKPSRTGVIRMRGKTDKGRRWLQETDLETAVVLVREHAAVVVNRHTIRRLYSNKSFRTYILNRDRYTCYFCGEYGDTIDHLLPRAKGGHTTPMNCVVACHECNQSKADRDLHEFIEFEDA
jgi:5-methylcytosine-specific restriction endonuclease McrA